MSMYGHIAQGRGNRAAADTASRLSLMLLATFSSTSHTSPAICALQMLTLSGNQLTGTIPPCFISAPELQELYMSGNRLDGPLPDNFNASKLMVFYASNQTERSLGGEQRALHEPGACNISGDSSACGMALPTLQLAG
jgi:hypothetical protein